AKDKIELQIQSTENGLATLSIYSINGMLIRQWTLNKQARLLQQTIPVNELAAGSYILQIRTAGWQKSKAFIKN
ncbi:MAG TPA: T9SS type A sorting domain-containing protein, partial [Flavisolibacter sp.]|nr:T9SS type A sorting domain-containing protein [Flavisolibacter sp.]